MKCLTCSRVNNEGSVTNLLQTSCYGLLWYLRGRSRLSTVMYSYRAYGGEGGHDASVLFLMLIFC